MNLLRVFIFWSESSLRWCSLLEKNVLSRSSRSGRTWPQYRSWCWTKCFSCVLDLLAASFSSSIFCRCFSLRFLRMRPNGEDDSTVEGLGWGREAGSCCTGGNGKQHDIRPGFFYKRDTISVFDQKLYYISYFKMESDGALIKKEWFIEGKEGRIEDFYSFDEKKTSMGSGQYGVVVKAIQKSNNQTRAIKIIKKKRVKDPVRLRTQVTILKKIDHPNVVRLYEIFETPEKLYLVMELCEGGEVFDRYLSNNGKADESTAKRIFRDVVNAIVYCHNHKICHRDLKPENLLLLSKTEPSSVKVIDFGLSAIFDHKQRMKTKAGTCYFISPEVLQGKYDQSCDVWSLGVILYFLVSGVPPFYGESEYEILEMVKKKEYTFDIPEFEGVCAEAKDLISRCLEPSNKRITAEAILHHPWLEHVEKPKSSLTMTLVDRFRNANKFKVLVLTYMATQLTYAELEYYQKMFRENDANHDGYLDYEELMRILLKTGVPNEQEARKITELIDTDRNGKINYTEFLTATIRPEIYSQPAKIKSAFCFFDKAGKCFINYEDVQRVVKNQISISRQEWAGVVSELDKEAKDVLSFGAFEKLMGRQ